MIGNTNASKVPSEGSFLDIPKFVGVASVQVKCVNPNNAKLRANGWSVPDEAPEPEYVKTKQDKEGKSYQLTRIRFLVEIQDLKEKPVVNMDFLCRVERIKGTDSGKYKIIDKYCRTAWATEEDVKARRVPQYTNGPASIATPYRPCHPGEEELITFLFKLLNVTPLNTKNPKTGNWEPVANPGYLTIDNWTALCAGDTKEIVSMLSEQPDNCVKVILGVQIDENNRAYQTFIPLGYIGNGSTPDRMTGKYERAQTLIDKYMEKRDASRYHFSASPVKEWSVKPDDVKENSDYAEEESLEPQDDDLPFD